jgi:hypothetical protein
MPNWVYHRTTVTGPKAEVERFERECITEGDETFHNYRTGKDDTRHFRILDFDKLAPAPEGFNMELTSPVPIEVELMVSAHETRPFASVFTGKNQTNLEYVRTFSWVPDELKEEHASVSDLVAFLITRKWPLDDAEKHAAAVTAEQQFASYQKNKDIAGCFTWYELNVKRFGTKWGACDCNIGQVEDLGEGTAKMEVAFDTAWSMPDPIWAAIFERFPELHWKGAVDEEGGVFHGYIDGREWDIRNGVSPERQAEYDAEEEGEEEEESNLPQAEAESEDGE